MGLGRNRPGQDWFRTRFQFLIEKCNLGLPPEVVSMFLKRNDMIIDIFRQLGITLCQYWKERKEN